VYGLAANATDDAAVEKIFEPYVPWLAFQA
jgi:hypothetical protein